jgi:hypothetical protein
MIMAFLVFCGSFRDTLFQAAKHDVLSAPSVLARNCVPKLHNEIFLSSSFMSMEDPHGEDASVDWCAEIGAVGSYSISHSQWQEADDWKPGVCCVQLTLQPRSPSFCFAILEVSDLETC